MITINIKTNAGEKETIKKFLLDGLEEQKRRMEYTLDTTLETIKGFEVEFGLSTKSFLEKFKSGEIKENEDIFRWWAETKIAEELKKNLNAITMIKICQ